MNVVAIVQARLSSTRLPGKVLADLAGAPMLQRILRRVQAAKTVGEVLVAVADEPGADAIVEAARRVDAEAWLGSADDVLDRYVQAARRRQADVIVRITADDPFKDPAVVDQVTTVLTSDPSVDYASNTLKPTFPEGLDVECVRMEALEVAWREARLCSEREHVTPFIWTRPTSFELRSVERTPDLSGHRWTVDHPDDLVFAQAVYQAMAPAEVFGLSEILDLLHRRPDIAALEPVHDRNEGYLRSIRAEGARAAE